jgi:hypothetical protein
MNNSSQDQNYIVISDNSVEDISIDISSVTTVDTSTWSTITPLSGITSIDTSAWANIAPLSGIDTITLTSGTLGEESFTFTNNWTLPNIEFEDCMPEAKRVNAMCKLYPGLEIAYKKFKEVYKMVKEDYDGKERERRSNK